jgi:site-specific DNA recombinase
LRVSTDRQADEGYGLEVQRRRIADFCHRERLHLVEEFIDPGVSGSAALVERPGLSAALDAACEPHVGGVVVARFDRLARDTLAALLIEREFAEVSAPVLYAEGLNGEEFEFLREIMHAASKHERKRILARMDAGKRAKAERGGYIGGRPPFGYEARAGALRPREAEAEVVRHIFNRVAYHGHSVREIATDLDARQVLDRRWHVAQVHAILGREMYKLGGRDLRVVDPRLWNRARSILVQRAPRRNRSG